MGLAATAAATATESLKKVLMETVIPWLQKEVLPLVRTLILQILSEEFARWRQRYEDWARDRDHERDKKAEEDARDADERAANSATDEERITAETEARMRRKFAEETRTRDEEWREQFTRFQQDMMDQVEARIRDIKVETKDGSSALVTGDTRVELAKPSPKKAPDARQLEKSAPSTDGVTVRTSPPDSALPMGPGKEGTSRRKKRHVTRRRPRPPRSGRVVKRASSSRRGSARS